MAAAILAAVLAQAERVKVSRVAESSKDPTEKNQVPPELEEIKEIYDLMLQENLEFIELQTKEGKLRLDRSRPQAQQAIFSADDVASVSKRRGPSPAAGLSAVPTATNRESILTPLAGVFYRASSPTGAAFVKEGDIVDAGQTLCLVEAMKVMNEIKAQKPCKITKIVAENSRPVTAGQALFYIEPA